MAGLQNAAAALLFLVQLGNVCGFDRIVRFTAVPGLWMDVKPLSLMVASITFIVMWKARLITTKIPPLLVGLGVGTALYYALVGAGLGSHLGSFIGLPDAVDSLSPLKSLNAQTDIASLLKLLPLIITGAFALAVVAALDALLCAKLVAVPGAGRIDGDKLLMRLGLGNMLSASFGGITSGINIDPNVANRTFGAKTYLSVLINAVVLLLVIGALFPIVSYTPRWCCQPIHHGDCRPAYRPMVDRPGSPHPHRRGRPSRLYAARSVRNCRSRHSLRHHQYCVCRIDRDCHRHCAFPCAHEPHKHSPGLLLRYNSFPQGAPPKEAALLETRGADILVLELQGVLFSAAPRR